MKINVIGTNQTVLTLKDDTEILFSYSQPVACHLSGIGYFKTEKKWSKTTTSHINRWIADRMSDTEIKPQSYFDSLVK